MVNLNWTAQSKQDLISIAEFIAQDSKKFAVVQINRIRSRAEQAMKFPKSGRVVPELNDKSVREFILGNYRIIYKIVSDQRVDILPIHHSARILKI